MTADPTLKSFQNHAAEFALSHTVGLYTVDDDGKSSVYGSGLLLEIGNRRFIVTAAHVAEDGKTVPLSVGVPNADPPFERIKGCRTSHSYSKCGDHTDDALDLAVVLLSARLTARLRETRRFLHVRDLDLGDPVTPFGMYLVLGLPAAGSSQDENKTTSNVLSISALPQRHDSVFAGDLDPQLHFILDYGRTPFYGKDGRTFVEPPVPNGISGCGVWRIGTATDFQHPERLPATKLVGIETGWYKTARVLKGTRIKLVIDLILTQYPELLPVLQLAWPVSESTPASSPSSGIVLP